MVKRNEPAATEADDDALFAPGSWDIGPPSARGGSLRPGARSARPPAEGAPAKLASVAPSEPSSAPMIEVASEPPTLQDLVLADEREPDSVSGARIVHPARRSQRPSATASFRPVVPEPVSRVPPRKRPSLAAMLPLASLLLSSAGVGYLVLGGPGATAEVEAAPRAIAASQPVQKPESHKPLATVAPLAMKATPPAANPATTAAADSGPALGATRVELEVYPTDAAVGYLGIMQKGGPKYAFEVPHGKKIAVEVARKGYGTRKVMLDGSQARVVIGLRKSKPAP